MRSAMLFLGVVAATLLAGTARADVRTVTRTTTTVTTTESVSTDAGAVPPLGAAQTYGAVGGTCGGALSLPTYSYHAGTAGFLRDTGTYSYGHSADLNALRAARLRDQLALEQARRIEAERLAFQGRNRFQGGFRQAGGGGGGLFGGVKAGFQSGGVGGALERLTGLGDGSGQVATGVALGVLGARSNLFGLGRR